MAVINIDDAYILNETGAQVDKTTGIPFKDESLTEAEAAQARANIRAGGTNPNLLDNPWFTVRQRGDGPFSGANTEAVDRWRTTSNSTVTGTTDGITLTTTVRTRGMQQRVAKDSLVVGKTYTISAMEQDGTITSATFTWTGSGMSKYVAGANVGFEISVSNANYNQIYITTNIVGSVYLRAVKLELGSVSTLANDAPPDYYDEFDHCKWYFERIKALSGNYAPMGFGYATSATAATIFVPMHAKRGSGYTVSSSGSFRLVYGQTTYTVTAISKYSSVSNNWLVLTVTSSGMTAGQPLEFGARGDSAAYIDVNNDL